MNEVEELKNNYETVFKTRPLSSYKYSDTSTIRVIKDKLIIDRTIPFETIIPYYLKMKAKRMNKKITVSIGNVLLTKPIQTLTQELVLGKKFNMSGCDDIGDIQSYDFLIYFLTLIDNIYPSHSNVVIYDTKKKQLEHFEPI